MNEGIHLDLDTWIVSGQIRNIHMMMMMMIGLNPGPRAYIHIATS